VLGILILGEPAGPRLFAGAALILTGAGLAARSPAKPGPSGS
jgi:drug/metabolite transporter (DMT)-like permease